MVTRRVLLGWVMVLPLAPRRKPRKSGRLGGYAHGYAGGY